MRVVRCCQVAATDRFDKRYINSNYGECVDLFAPGVGITSASNVGVDAYEVTTGTSLASSVVAGLAAQYLQMDPLATHYQVKSFLVSNAWPVSVNNAGPRSPRRLARVAELFAPSPLEY